LSISVPSQYDFLIYLVNNSIWLVIHLLCAVIVGLSLAYNRWHVVAMSISSGFMGAWGLFSLLAALTAVSPVSLAGPVLAIVLSVVAHAMAVSWATVPKRRLEA
jgi:uncharacterized membrane protein YesL